MKGSVPDMATGYDGSIRIDTKIDSSGVEDGVNKIGSSLKGLGAAIAAAFATKALVAFGQKAVEVASDLSEVQNVVDTTFGEGAAKIEEFAKSAATQFGLSELSAKQYSSTLGAMFKSMGLGGADVEEMSTSLTGLAGDMASFYNLDTSVAFEKLRSGISGETEPLKQLGINMSEANLKAYALSQGITTAYSSMTEAEKAALRYDYIMQVTADAQGDFAKTSDGLANQQRILQLNMENLAASVGEALLPTVNELTTALNGLLSGEMDGEQFGVALAGALTNAANAIVENLPALLDTGIKIIAGIVSGIGEGLPQLLPAVVEAITTIVQGLIDNIPMLIDAALKLIVGLAQGLLAALPVLIKALPEIITGLINALLESIPLLIQAGIDLLTSLVTALPEIISAIVEAIPQIISGIITALMDNLPKIIQAGVDLFLALIDALPEILVTLATAMPQIILAITDALVDNIDEIIECGVLLLVALVENLPAIIAGVVEAIPKIIAAIVEAFVGLGGKIVEIGENLIKGLWEGIVNMATWIADKITGFFTGIVDGVKDFLGIHSPSKVFAEIGGYAMEGMAEGIKGGENQATDAARKAAEAVSNASVVNFPESEFENIAPAFARNVIDPISNMFNSLWGGAADGATHALAGMRQDWSSGIQLGGFKLPTISTSTMIPPSVAFASMTRSAQAPEAGTLQQLAETFKANGSAGERVVIENVVNLDGREIWRNQKVVARQMGKSFVEGV